MEGQTARVYVGFNETLRRWESEVTFDVPISLGAHKGEVMRDGLCWPYWRARSRFRKRVIMKAVRALLRSPTHEGPIEIVPTRKPVVS